MKRILLVCHNLGKVEEIVERGVAIANEIDAKITLLFIHEVELFNFFSKEEPFEKGRVWKQLKALLSQRSREDAVVLVEEGDSADWVEQEIAKEESSFIVMDYVESVSAKIVERVGVPCLIFKRYQKEYTKGLLATEISQPKECFEFAQNFVKNIAIYMDSLVIPVPYIETPVPDVAGDVVDVELYEEILQENRQKLEEFCKERNIECSFDTGEEELAINILTVAIEKGADLLIVSALENLSQLGVAIDTMIEKSSIDILLCQRGIEGDE